MNQGGVSGHLFFMLLVVTMGAVLVALAISIIVYRKMRGDFSYLIAITACIALNVFCNSVAVYLVTNVPGIDFTIILGFFLSATYFLGPLTAVFPIYLNSVLQIRNAKRINLFFIALTAVLMILYLHGLLFDSTVIAPDAMRLDYSPIIKVIFLIDTAIAVTYMAMVLFRGKKIQDPNLRKMIRSLGLTIALFTPGILIAMRIKFGNMRFREDLIENYIYSSLFFLAWNIVIAYYLLRYFFYTPREPVIIAPPEAFIKRYSITERESEVIRLLAHGHSNNDISEELSISLATVKSHLSNIYTKTGAKTRTELIRLIINNMVT